MDTSRRVTFLKKLKVLLNIKLKTDEKIECHFLYKILFHSLNYLYIFGGWIVVAHLLDRLFVFKVGYVSSLLSLLLWSIFNILVIYFISCRKSH